MATELASAYVSLLPSFRGGAGLIQKELAPSLNKASAQVGQTAGGKFTGAFSKSFKTLATGFAAVFAGQAAIGFFKDAINGASDLAETGSKVEQIFGSQGAAIQKFASTANTALGQTRQGALDAAATFGVFGKAAGLTGQPLTKFSTDMVSLATDMASFGNTSPEQAVEAIGAALRGESEPIRQYGILLDDATLRQRALALGLIKTTKDALTPQQKALAAQAEILAQTSDQQGDFQRTSGGLANQQRILSAQWSDMKTSLGKGLLPVVTAVVTFFNAKLVPAFGKVGGFLRENVLPHLKDFGTFVKSTVVPAAKELGQELADRLAPTLSDIGDFIRDRVVPALKDFGGFLRDTVVPAIRDFAGWLKENQAWLTPIAVGIVAIVAALKLYSAGIAIVSAVTKAWAVVQGVLNAVMSANPIGLVVLALVGLVAGLTYAWKTSETFRDVVTGVWNFVKDTAVTAFNAVVGAVKTAFDWVATNWPLILAIITGPIGLAVLAIVRNWDTIKGAFVSGWNWIRDKAINPMVAGFQAVWDKAVVVKDGIVGAFGAISESVGSAFTTALNAIKQGINWVIGVVNDYFIDGLNVVVGVIPGLDEIPDIPLIKMHSGGIVPGRGEVPRMLLGGEAVLNPRATSMLGPEVIRALNKGEGFGGPFDDWNWDSIKAGIGVGVDQSLGNQATANALEKGLVWVVKNTLEPAKNKVLDLIPKSPLVPNGVTRGTISSVYNALFGWAKDKDGDRPAGGKISGRMGTGFPLPAGSYSVGVGLNGYPGHTGQDFPAPTGTPVFSPFAGMFTGVNLGNRSYGRYANVVAGSLRFIGAHLSALVGGNRLVKMGEMIGRVGDTGNSFGSHLHAEFRENGVVQDPHRYLKFDSGMGVLPTGHSLVYNGTGGPEPLVDPRRLSIGAPIIQTFGTQASMVNDIRFAMQVYSNERQAVMA